MVLRRGLHRLRRGSEALTAQIVGRERERSSLEGTLSLLPTGPVAVLIEGEAGIGKSTLWHEAMAMAEAAGTRVLVSRPIQSEAQLPFTTLGDLLSPVIEDLLPQLPGSQSRALQVIFRLTEQVEPLDHRALALAFLGAVRLLASDKPLMLAIDDLQWLDPASAQVLVFGLRRLQTEPVGVMATLRSVKRMPELWSALSRSYRSERVRALSLGAMAPDEVEILLVREAKGALPRPQLQMIARACGGNPYFALQILSTVAAAPPSKLTGRALPIPDSLRALVRDRLANLPEGSREALLAISALAQPTMRIVGAVLGDAARSASGLSRAAHAQVIEVDGERIRFAHPLLGSVLYAEVPKADRRDMHRRLAEVVDDPQERVLHLALGTEGPNTVVADLVERQAQALFEHGAPAAAAELFQHARRLSEPGAVEDMVRRLLANGACHLELGDVGRARALFEEAAAIAPRGPLRAEALRRVARASFHSENWVATQPLLTQALGQAGEDRRLRADIELDLAYALYVSGDTRAAARQANVALESAEALGETSLARALAVSGTLDFFAGIEGWRTKLERARTFPGPFESDPVQFRPSIALGRALMYADEPAEARTHLTAGLARAQEMGDEFALPYVHVQLAQLEARAGRWDLSEQHALAAMDGAEQAGQLDVRAAALHVRGFLRCCRGEEAPARADLQESAEVARRTGSQITLAHARRALGLLELSWGRPAEAMEHFDRLAESVRALGIVEPGIVRGEPDTVESLAALGQFDRASEVLDAFEDAGRATGRRWALAAASRCRALLLAAGGDAEAATARAEEAVEAFSALEEPFELARTHLVAGLIQRRSKQKLAAREAFSRAERLFEDLGASRWAARAAEEAARTGRRTTEGGELTETEQRVADLVAKGRSNREIADELFMSLSTVEVNLSRVYRKLGVKSRTELVRLLSSR